MTYGNGYYTRTPQGWVYTATGAPVPGAADFRVGKRTYMYAPELHPELLLTIEAAAEWAGMLPSSWRQLALRGDAPAPVLKIGRTPLWTHPILVHWDNERPGRDWRKGQRNAPADE